MTEQTTLHVLLVDDDQDDRFLLKGALTKLGTSVKFDDAAGCLEAMEKLENMQEDIPDVIFIDLNMPDIDGFECIRKIKAKSLWADIPLIIYSTSNNHVHIVEAGKLGAKAYIKKPNDFWELCAKMEKVLSMDLKAVKDYLGVLE